MQQYHRCFPNLDSIWAYSGSSPGTHSGAQQHMKVWEKATRGKKVPDMEKGLADVQRYRKGDQAATWDKDSGYHGDAPMSYADALAAVEADQSVFESFFLGSEEVQDAGSGPMYDYYQKLHRLVGHAEIPDADKAKWEVRLQMVLRLRYWAKVRQKFGVGYKAQLEAGFKQGGIAEPSWATLSRADLQVLSTKMTSMAMTGPDATEAARLVMGLWSLDKDVIPPQWV